MSALPAELRPMAAIARGLCEAVALVFGVPVIVGALVFLLGA